MSDDPMNLLRAIALIGNVAVGFSPPPLDLTRIELLSLAPVERVQVAPERYAVAEARQLGAKVETFADLEAQRERAEQEERHRDDVTDLGEKLAEDAEGPAPPPPPPPDDVATFIDERRAQLVDRYGADDPRVKEFDAVLEEAFKQEPEPEPPVLVDPTLDEY